MRTTSGSQQSQIRNGQVLPGQAILADLVQEAVFFLRHVVEWLLAPLGYAEGAFLVDASTVVTWAVGFLAGEMVISIRGPPALVGGCVSWGSYPACCTESAALAVRIQLVSVSAQRTFVFLFLQRSQLLAVRFRRAFLLILLSAIFATVGNSGASHGPDQTGNGAKWGR